MCYEFKGNLKEFISDMKRMLTEIAMVKLGLPDNIISFSILAELNEDLWNVVDTIILKEVIFGSPQATLTKIQEIVHLEQSCKSKDSPTSTTKTNDTQSKSASALMHKSKKGKHKSNKPRGPVCKDEKHNPQVKYHDHDHCWQIHPEIQEE